MRVEDGIKILKKSLEGKKDIQKEDISTEDAFNISEILDEYISNYLLGKYTK